MRYIAQTVFRDDDLMHFGVKGMKWGVRNKKKYVREDGSLTKKGIKKNTLRKKQINDLQKEAKNMQRKIEDCNSRIASVAKNGTKDKRFQEWCGYTKQDKLAVDAYGKTRSFKQYMDHTGVDIASGMRLYKRTIHSNLSYANKRLKEIPKEVNTIRKTPLYRHTYEEAHKKAMKRTAIPAGVAGAAAGIAAGSLIGNPITVGAIGGIIGLSKGADAGMKLRDYYLKRDEKHYGKLKQSGAYSDSLMHFGVKGMKWGVRKQFKEAQAIREYYSLRRKK